MLWCGQVAMFFAILIAYVVTIKRLNVMKERLPKMMNRYRVFLLSLAVTAVIVLIKVVLHETGNEVLTLGSLHTGVVTGTFFVIGFLLSTTIADYKESERIPSEFSAIIENMYEDAEATHASYPDFDIAAFRKQLRKIAQSFADDVRRKRHSTRLQVHKLNATFTAMEKAGVPPNYVVKLKQQQAQLVRVLFRVTYIQRITFIPSASILARSIVPITILLLLFTEVEPIFGGITIVAIISFILIYMLRLIHVISTPFQRARKTQDDVSLFLVDETVQHLSNRK